MKASAQDKFVAQLFFKAAFPVMKVVLQDHPKFKKTWEKVQAVVQFRGKDDEGDLYTSGFDNGDFKVVQGEYETSLTW